MMEIASFATQPLLLKLKLVKKLVKILVVSTWTLHRSRIKGLM